MIHITTQELCELFGPILGSLVLLAFAGNELRKKKNETTQLYKLELTRRLFGQRVNYINASSDFWVSLNEVGFVFGEDAKIMNLFQQCTINPDTNTAINNLLLKLADSVGMKITTIPPIVKLT